MNAGSQGSALNAETLRLRARVLSDIREFFRARGVLEVDTPALSPAANPDPALEPVRARVQSLGAGACYLQTSPELAMKRLLARGSGDIFQLCRVFRDGELGRWHQPEFVMLEWYRVGIDEHALMDEVFELLTTVLGAFGQTLEDRRLTYAEAFEHAIGVDLGRSPSMVERDLAAALGRAQVALPDETLPLGALLDLALSTTVIPSLEHGAVWFIHDYPADQAALAELNPGDPPVAARFEVFVNGLELGNGYRELTDPAEQRRRFESDVAKRNALGRTAPAVDEAFLAAMDAGLPACSGIAVGVDRLIALAAGADELASVVNFALGRDTSE